MCDDIIPQILIGIKPMEERIKVPKFSMGKLKKIKTCKIANVQYKEVKI